MSPAIKEDVSSPNHLKVLTESLVWKLAEYFTIALFGFSDVISFFPFLDMFCYNMVFYLSAYFLEFFLAFPESNEPISLISLDADILTILDGFSMAYNPDIPLHL